VNKKSFFLLLAAITAAVLFSNCNNVAPDGITVLQVHLEDSLSVQAGHYDSVRIDLTDKDGKVIMAGVFSGPYDKIKDKAKLENIEVPANAPTPIRIVISVYKAKVKQTEFVFQVASDKVAKSEPSTFVPPIIKKDTVIKKDSLPKIDTVIIPPIDTTKPKDTTKVPQPGRVTLSSKEIELYQGGDSVDFSVAVQPSDAGKELIFKSSDEGVFMVAGGRHLFPKNAGQAILIAFIAGFPSTGDTAKVRVIKDPPVIDAGIDRRVPLDSSVFFPIHISQKYGSVKSLKWDLDGDGKYDDSASKSDTTLAHTYKTKGEYTLKFYVRDSEGNDTTKTIKLQAGILTPFVVITKPGSDTTVNFTPFIVEYRVDGVPKTKSVPLKSGKTIVPISESNQYGVGSDTVTITLDTVPPGKPVFNALSSAFSRIRRPTWSWAQNATDRGNGTFKIRLDGIGDSIITTAQLYTASADLIDGSHFLQIQERDQAGNWSEPVTQTIYVDLAKPMVTIESPSTQSIFRTGESSVTLSGSGSDLGGISAVTYTVGSKITNASGTDKWKTGSIPIIDNTTTMVIVSIEDKAGNVGVDTVWVQSDKRGPGVSITQPSAVGTFFTTTGTLDFKGTASDSSTIKYVKYSLSGATNESGDATGTSNWQIPTLYLSPGVTQLAITAYDSLLNPGTLLLDITYKPGIYLVDASAKGKNTGTNWADAFTDLQSALAINIVGEVWVAKGTYKPTSGSDRSISFVTQPSVHLYGGFKGNETVREQRSLANNVSILSGDIGTSVATDNSYHVVRGASNSTIDGFTITSGYAEVPSTENAKGAGVYANGFSPNLVNCQIQNNYAVEAGGGIYFVNSISQIINCIFADNVASYNGGGAIWTGGNSSPVILHALFIRNKTTNSGGAIWVGATSNVSIKNSLFSSNESPYGKNIGLDGVLTLQYTNADSTYDGGVERMGSGAAEVYWVGNSYRVPLFVGPTDYHLKPGSPGIDEGIDGPEIPKFDINGGLRPKGKGMDLGPYEQ